MKLSPVILIPTWLVGVSAAFWLITHAMLELRIVLNAWNI